MVKIPYGISHFPTMIEEKYFYQDRTVYIRQIEEQATPFVFFLRPRRFGKSLFVSTLHHYYGIEFKDRFVNLFGGLDIGKNPTITANSYFVLSFEFSRIMTNTSSNTFEGFLSNVKESVGTFLKVYESYFDLHQRANILSQQKPNEVVKQLFDAINQNKLPHSVFILIDEYDHFANELISFNFDYFKEAVTENGFVRKFYESIKTATGFGIVKRLFVTGVSPITLDSMTSGFNISSNISLETNFHPVLGFEESEVNDLLLKIGIEESEANDILSDLRNWYDGYLFSPDAKNHMYNPDMVLYFVQFYQNNKKYPTNLLDPNIATDYSKIRNIFKIQNRETENIEVLRILSEEGSISAQLTNMFNFEKEFSQDNLTSLLFYMGFLTIEKADFAGTVFKFPNFVIKKLYSDYFLSFLQKKAQLPIDNSKMNASIRTMAKTGDPHSFFNQIEEILKNLSNRDALYLNDMSLKAIFDSCLHQQQFYYVHSEYETSKGYVDIFLEAIRGYNPDHQIAFELKYLKKSDSQSIDDLFAEGILQLKNYLTSRKLITRKGLIGFVVVVKGDILKWEQYALK